MRKVILACLLMIGLVASVSAIPFASDLKSAPSGDDIQISFRLNDSADSVIVTILDGGTPVKVIDAGALAGPGEQSVLWDKTDASGDPVMGTFTFQIQCSNTTGYADFTKISDGNTTNIKFFYPAGVACNTDQNSDYFGRIYVANPAVDTTASPPRTPTSGIFILGADWSDITGQGDTAYAGGVDWSDSIYSCPRDCDLDEDGNLFITDWSDTHSGIWIMDESNPGAAFDELFDTTIARDGSGIRPGGGDDALHGSIQWCQVEGSGAARKLYTIDEDGYVDGEGPGSILRYDIGTASTNWNTTPTVVYPDNSFGGISMNGSTCCLSDGVGGWWLAQYRWGGAANNPNFWHFTGTSIDVLGYNGNPILGGYTPAASYRGRLAIDWERDLMYQTRYWGTSQIRVWDISDSPTTITYVSDIVVGSNSNLDLTMDAANNLIFVNSGIEELGAYSPPGPSSKTTAAPASAAISVTTRPNQEWEYLANEYANADANLSLQVVAPDLITTVTGTLSGNGFHSATQPAADADRVATLGDGAWASNGLTVIAADTDGNSQASFTVEYDWSAFGQEADIEYIAVFAGHQDASGGRGFINCIVEVDNGGGGGYVELDQLLTGPYGMAGVANPSAYVKWTDPGSMADGIDKIKFTFHNVSHSSTGFFQAFDDNTTTPPTNYPNQGTVLKEIDVVGTLSDIVSSVEDWMLLDR